MDFHWYFNEIPIGIKNFAWTLFSNNNGINPTNVVNDVKKIGLNRRGPDAIIALYISLPSFLYLLIKSTKHMQN